jgi:hypothetical protein
MKGKTTYRIAVRLNGTGKYRIHEVQGYNVGDLGVAGLWFIAHHPISVEDQTSWKISEASTGCGVCQPFKAISRAKVNALLRIEQAGVDAVRAAVGKLRPALESAGIYPLNETEGKS